MPLASCSVEARDVSQHPAMRGTAPTMENDLNQNVGSVKAEKPRSSVVIALLKAGTTMVLVHMCLALSVVEACARDCCPCLVWGAGEPELNPEDRKKKEKEEGHTEQRAWSGQPPGGGRDICGSAGCSL